MMKFLIEKLKKEYNFLIECYPKGGFYYKFYSPEWGPNSKGNADDVYFDGYNSGFAQGKLDLVVELLKELGEDSEVDYKRLEEEVE